MDIVTNPPYGDLANKCLAHALRVHRPAKMAALLNLNFMCGFDDPDRRYVMDENPPSRVYVFTRRLPMMHRDDWDGNRASSQMNTGWFVWERNDDGSYGRGRGRWETIRIDWSAFDGVPALPPGEARHVDPPDGEAEDFSRETPRMTTGERVERDYARAMAWIGDRGLAAFTTGDFRRGLGLRDSVATALVDALAANGLIAAGDDGLWRAATPPEGARAAAGGENPSPSAAMASASPLPALLSSPTGGEVKAAPDLYTRAVALVRETRQTSPSMLQRRLAIGWEEASGLIERMTAEKVLPLERIGAGRARKAVA
jgi:hypothetical protein